MIFDRDKTRLEVREGLVLFTDLYDRAVKPVRVAGGYYAEAGPSVMLAGREGKLPPKPAEMAVLSLTLVDSRSGEVLAGFDPIKDGDVLKRAELPTSGTNIRANVRGKPASVTFWLDGKVYNTENGAPFMLQTDRAKGYGVWPLVLGRHTLKATPFGAQSKGRSHYQPGGGKAGKSFEIQFEVVEK